MKVDTKLDAVVALGKNWKHPIKDNTPLQLSIESQFTALAAAQLYLQGKVSHIIFSTGHTAGKKTDGTLYPTEAEAMYTFLRNHYDEDQIPDSAILLETDSWDTAGNAAEVKKLMKNHHLSSFILLTIGFHTKRAHYLFTKQHLSPDIVLSSEQVLLTYKFLSHSQVTNYYHSFHLLKEKIKEYLAYFIISTLDPRGDVLLRKITTKSRHRTHD